MLFRYLGRVRTPTLASKNVTASTPALKGLRVIVDDDDEHLGKIVFKCLPDEMFNFSTGISTDYSYSVNLSPSSDTIEIHAKSVYGAIYGMDSFWQVI